MFEKLKKQALRRGMKMMSHPKFMRAMADPRVMKAISEGFAIHGRVKGEMDDAFQKAARFFNVATNEDVKELKRTLRQMEHLVDRMERKLDED